MRTSNSGKVEKGATGTVARFGTSVLMQEAASPNPVVSPRSR